MSGDFGKQNLEATASQSSVSKALVAELRSDEGTAGQYLADLLRRAADALESEFERGYQEGLDDERL